MHVGAKVRTLGGSVSLCLTRYAVYMAVFWLPVPHFLVRWVSCLLTLAKPPMKRALFRGGCGTAPHPMRLCA